MERAPELYDFWLITLDVPRGRGKFPPNGSNGTARRVIAGVGPRKYLLLNVLHKIMNLPLYLFHALSHLQDNGNSADVHAQITRVAEHEPWSKAIVPRETEGVRPATNSSSHSMNSTSALSSVALLLMTVY
jgi:hypothetical protein